jgi:hypothetical protein
MHSRAEFSAATKREAFKRSHGICECHRVAQLRRPKGCGVRLVDGGTFYEHISTSFHSSDNSLDNCAALATACWKQKTAKHDLPSIAKTKRVADLAHGIRQNFYRPLAGTNRSNIRIPMRGLPTWRDSGKPVWRRT